MSLPICDSLAPAPTSTAYLASYQRWPPPQPMWRVKTPRLFSVSTAVFYTGLRTTRWVTTTHPLTWVRAYISAGSERPHPWQFDDHGECRACCPRGWKWSCELYVSLCCTMSFVSRLTILTFGIYSGPLQLYGNLKISLSQVPSTSLLIWCFAIGRYRAVPIAREPTLRRKMRAVNGCRWPHLC